MSMTMIDDETGAVTTIETVDDVARWSAQQDAAVLDVQVATAKRFPRSVQKFQSDLESWATLNRDSAMECFYSLPRDNKTVIGPSVRFAELVQVAYGNIVVDSQVIDEGRESILVSATARDLERNIASRAQVRRNIMTSAKGGRPPRRYSVDMIATTVQAASAIARRNAIFQIVPKALWSQIYEKARKVAHGDMANFVQRRNDLAKALKDVGADPANVKAALGGREIKDWTADDALALELKLRSIRAGEITVAQAFPDPRPEEPEQGRSAVRAQEALAKAKSPEVDPADAAFGLTGDE